MADPIAPNTAESTPYMTPAEVADLFRVSTKTVTRWASTGRLRTATRTPGGHRRFARADVDAFLIPPTPADEP